MSDGVPIRIADVDIDRLESALGRRTDAEDGTARVGTGEVSRLVRALDDDDEDVRCVAATALGAVGEQSLEMFDGPGPVAGLAQALDDESAAVRREAATALERVGRSTAREPDAVEALVGADAVAEIARVLAAADGSFQEAVDGLLGTRGKAVTVDGLIDYLDDDRVVVRVAAVERVKELVDKNPELFADTETVDRFLVLREADRPDVREAATFALAGASYARPAPGPAIEGVLDGLDDPDERVRAGAVKLVGRLGTAAPGSLPGTEWMAALLDALDDDHPRVRQQAAEALGGIGSEQSALLAGTDAVDRLRTAADDEDDAVRAAAAESLDAIQRTAPELLDGER